MKPMHSEVVRIGLRNRCPCCQTKYSTQGAYKLKTGKRIARQQARRQINRAIKEL